MICLKAIDEANEKVMGNSYLFGFILGNIAIAVLMLQASLADLKAFS